MYYLISEVIDLILSNKYLILQQEYYHKVKNIDNYMEKEAKKHIDPSLIVKWAFSKNGILNKHLKENNRLNHF